MREAISNKIGSRTRDDWTGIFDGSDACFAPVLTAKEATAHPHHRDRGTFTELGGVVQPAPAPRFSVTAPEIRSPPPVPGEHSESALPSMTMAARSRHTELKS